MRTVLKACKDLVAELKAAGFTGSAIDPADVNPPAAVWVDPRSIRDLTLGDSGTLEVWLWLIAPDTDPVQAMKLLDDGLEGLLELDYPIADGAEGGPVDLRTPVLLPNNPNPLPAYRVAFELDL